MNAALRLHTFQTRHVSPLTAKPLLEANSDKWLGQAHALILNFRAFSLEGRFKKVVVAGRFVRALCRPGLRLPCAVGHAEPIYGSFVYVESLNVGGVISSPLTLIRHHTP